jgi:hypothetical protein
VGILGFVPDLVRKYPLRGFDAIHLASALWLRDALRLGKAIAPEGQSVAFVTSDKQLQASAIAETLEVFGSEHRN